MSAARSTACVCAPGARAAAHRSPTASARNSRTVRFAVPIATPCGSRAYSDTPGGAPGLIRSRPMPSRSGQITSRTPSAQRVIGCRPPLTGAPGASATHAGGRIIKQRSDSPMSRHSIVFTQRTAAANRARRSCTNGNGCRNLTGNHRPARSAAVLASSTVAAF